MFLLAISLWVTLGEKNGGIAAFVFTEGIFLKSPLAIGLCLMVASLLCLITGGFIGPRKVSNTILAGMESAKHRKALGWYQLLATTSVILFALVLVSTVTPINKLNERGITPSLWRDMSLSHPDRICTFEVENKCAGSRNQTCTSISARINKGCPGHYCYSNCASASGRRRTNSSTCATCKSSFSSLKSLKRCKGSEANSSTSGTCLDILRKEVKRFYMIATISSGIGLSCMVLVSIVGTLGPILSAHY